MKSTMHKRIEALEGIRISGKWVRIIQHCGESDTDAIARYEGIHGALGDADNIIMRFIVPSGMPTP